MATECEHVTDELDLLVAGDSAAIARCSEHLASCDDCRDARFEATRLAGLIAGAGDDHVAPADLLDRVLAAADLATAPTADLATAPTAAMEAQPVPAPAPAPAPAPVQPAPDQLAPVRPLAARTKPRPRVWLAVGAAAAIAASSAGIYLARDAGSPSSPPSSPEAPRLLANGGIGQLTTVERAASGAGGVEVRDGAGWRPLSKGDALPAGAELRTDGFTRASLALADGTTLVLDHRTELAFDRAEPRALRLAAGRLVADVAHVERRPASIATPMGKIDVLGTRFAVTATDALTAVQVVRGTVALTDRRGTREEVRAGEEGLADATQLTVTGAPGLHREVEWSELSRPRATDDAAAGLGQLRAYKPGEQRDRDWNLALAKHDVKVRIVGPVARTEITETFRNDSDQTLEGVYQFPLPADARIDELELDVPGGFEAGAFIDKQRAAKIWRGVIEQATPKSRRPPVQEIIWVDGSWRDPALLDWKRGGRFELRIFPIPPKGARTIKLSYTQIVTPRGAWRQYVYPLPHSADGSTVADQLTVDVEVRGASNGMVRAANYDLAPDPARRDVNALTLAQSGFVPRGDLVVDYRAADGDAELRAWTFAGGAAIAPDEKLAAKKQVGIDPAVVAAQRAEAADVRPTAVLALRPKLPRWRESTPRDYAIVVDASQSMVGERTARAAQLVAAIVDEMDRRDRFTVLACDSECRLSGDARAPSAAASKDVTAFLTAQPAAGASDVVAGIREATRQLPRGEDRERWVLYIGDGFATTGFRRVADVERAIADATGAGTGIRVAAIGIGGDADAALLTAVARAGGGSYVAWVPGQSTDAAAVASLESTYGAQLRNATIELPAGLADVAPSVLPTIRAGEETLVAARITGEVKGDVVVRGTVGGQPFEQRYPLALAVSTAAGNGFVPRLWASLAIEQLERTGLAADRTKIVALSQGYGVMSRETSLLVLESAAMFEAFGVDRGSAAKWTGEEDLDEVVTKGTIGHAAGGYASGDADIGGARASGKKDATAENSERRAGAHISADDLRNPFGADEDAAANVRRPPPAAEPAATKVPPPPPAKNGVVARRAPSHLPPPMIAMRRTWVRVPSVSAWGGVPANIQKAVTASETALAEQPDSRERHRNLVQALSYAGQLDRALEIARKWLDRDKLDPQALGYQADLLARDGQRPQALRTLAGLVDLDADRAALHERMVLAYDHVGRAEQACSHRIALAALAGKADAIKAAAGAVRCLRAIARERDAELILRALPDDAARAATEKAVTVAPVAARPGGDLVISARWDGGEDLDISVITPEGASVSWMGGRADVRVTDATSTAREELAIRALRRGNYLVEISRGTPATGGPTWPAVRGSLEISVLGTKQTLPFELTGSRVVAGRIAVALEERLETIDPGSLVARVAFGQIAHPRLRQIMLARSPSVQQCYATALAQNPILAGTITLTISIDANGSTQTRTRQSPELAVIAACIQAQLASMHVEGSAPQTLRVPLTLRAAP